MYVKYDKVSPHQKLLTQKCFFSSLLKYIQRNKPTIFEKCPKMEVFQDHGTAFYVNIPRFSNYLSLILFFMMLLDSWKVIVAWDLATFMHS